MGKKNKKTQAKTIAYDAPCECIEDKKSVKKRYKSAKKQLEDTTDLLERVDMSYDSKQQAIGSMYMNVRRIKRQLKNY